MMNLSRAREVVAILLILACAVFGCFFLVFKHREKRSRDSRRGKETSASCTRLRDIQGLLNIDSEKNVTVHDKRPLVVVLSWKKCGHCITMKPHWRDAVESIPPQSLSVIWLEYDDEVSTPDNDSIRYLETLGLHDNRFPRILYWQAGAESHNVYTGNRSKESIERLFRDLIPLEITG